MVIKEYRVNVILIFRHLKNHPTDWAKEQDKGELAYLKGCFKINLIETRAIRKQIIARTFAPTSTY